MSTYQTPPHSGTSTFIVAYKTLNVVNIDTIVEVISLAQKTKARLLYHRVSFDRFVNIIRYLTRTPATSCPKLGEAR